jgi:hypothetical protein
MENLSEHLPHVCPPDVRTHAAVDAIHPLRAARSLVQLDLGHGWSQLPQGRVPEGASPCGCYASDYDFCCQRTADSLPTNRTQEEEVMAKPLASKRYQGTPIPAGPVAVGAPQVGAHPSALGARPGVAAGGITGPTSGKSPHAFGNPPGSQRRRVKSR